MTNFISYNQFNEIDIRLGTIIKAKECLELKNPYIILEIDFGENIGIKKSLAQLLKYYNSKDIVGKQIAAVTNFKPKQIGKHISEVLVLGFPDNDNQPILIAPDKKISNGVKLF